MRYIIGLVIIIALAASTANAAPWLENKDFLTENAALPASKVDAADLDGDGHIDLVFANGAGFDKGNDFTPRTQQAFLNGAGGPMKDVSAAIFKGTPYNGRAVKLRDIDHDGDIDIMLGTTWQTQSQLFINNSAGGFSNETASHLPQIDASIGDLELGDVDDDGDLDMMLADWGSELPASSGPGGFTKLWLQMGSPAAFGEPGTAMFEDATVSQMPIVKVRWSWDVEFVDVDNDYDLDILVSSFASDAGSLFLFTNDGKGVFTDATAEVEQGLDALEVEPMDLNGDTYLDLVTLYDGAEGRNRVLINDKSGGFDDATDLVWPKAENPPTVDVMAVFYDHDSDEQVDLLVSAFPDEEIHPDRLMLNQGGKFTRWGADQDPMHQAFEELTLSTGTFAVVLADLDKDTRLDVAMAQNLSSFEKKVLLATAEIPVDTAPPIFVNHEQLGPLQYPSHATLRVRCHDNKSPLMLHDFNQDQGLPYLEFWTDFAVPDPDANPGTRSDPGQWYGEYLWRIDIAVPEADALFYRLCAIDAAGNKACTAVLETPISTADTDSSEPPTGGMSSATTDPTQGGSETIGATAASESNSADSTPTDTFVSTSGSTDTASSADTVDGIGPLVDPAGCVCNSAHDRLDRPDRSTSRAGLAWLLLPLLLRRRSRLRGRGLRRRAIPRRA